MSLPTRSSVLRRPMAESPIILRAALVKQRFAEAELENNSRKGKGRQELWEKLLRLPARLGREGGREGEREGENQTQPPALPCFFCR